MEESVRTEPNVVGSEGASSDFHARFIQQAACPALVGMLWSVKGLISLASTYVSYIVILSFVGVIVPAIFSSPGSRRFNRGILAAMMGLLWLSIVLAAYLGALAPTLGSLLILWGDAECDFRKADRGEQDLRA